MLVLQTMLHMRQLIFFSRGQGATASSLRQYESLQKAIWCHVRIFRRLTYCFAWLGCMVAPRSRKKNVKWRMCSIFFVIQLLAGISFCGEHVKCASCTSSLKNMHVAQKAADSRGASSLSSSAQCISRLPSPNRIPAGCRDQQTVSCCHACIHAAFK